ncbi:MAG: DinB family protein [Gemmatimonadota bacterium]|nr:DinB family protein [Gemmatimonadota bacterium]
MRTELNRIARLATLAVIGGILLGALPGVVAAQSWTAEERETLLDALEASAKDLMTSIDGLSEAQWTFQQTADQWSVQQVTEHLALTEELIGGLLAGLGSGDKVDTWREGRAEIDAMIREGLQDRSQRFQAPESVTPMDNYDSREEMLKAFKDSRTGVMELVKSTDIDLRAYTGEHPAFGAIDGHQWVLLLTSHVWRHLDQIAEVKADPGYPSH